jgi:ligand-binding sensor domain-containing protein
LNRYDGTFFIQYSILSQPALSNSSVTTIMQDAKGLIWIGTENGLNILDPCTNTIRQYIHRDTVPSSLPAGPIRSIQTLRNGHIYVMSEKWLVEFTDAQNFSPVHIDSSLVQENNVMVAITEINDQQLWLSYLDHPTILVKRNSQNGRSQIGDPALKLNDYSKMYIDPQQHTWGISSYGIGSWNNTSQQYESWLKNPYTVSGPNLHLRAAHCVDATGNVWQGNDRGGLVKYNIQQRQVTDYSSLLTMIKASIVFCLYKDNNNTIWAGTDNGIIKLANREAPFTNLSFSLQGSELKNVRCRRIIADRYNNLYAGTENYGFLKHTRTATGRDTTIALSVFGAPAVDALPVVNNATHLRLDGRYDIGYIYDMWYDGQDYLWMVGYGISRYNIQTGMLDIYFAPGGEKERLKSINQFTIANDGHLFWTAGLHNLYTFDPAIGAMQPFRDPSGNMPFDELPCWSIAIKGGYLWTGTANGLYKVNTRTREVKKESVHRVLDFGINDITFDDDSTCWISTAGGGVIRYNIYTREVKQYTNKDGLSNNTVCGLLFDNKHNCWITTYAGLSYLNRQTGQFTNFYAKDGLNTDEFNRKALCKLSNGKMIVGGLNGYMQFDPAKVFTTVRPVTMALTRFSKIDRDGITIDSIFNLQSFTNAVIAPGDKYFSFHFMLSDQYDPAGNRYFYQLHGVDDVWHPLGNQHFVSFSGLSPGKYTLKIKGNTGGGSGSINELTIYIQVKQVFYRTIWFMALLIMAIAVIAWLVVRYRIRQVKKIQYLRTRIASDLHDDVGSSLVRITVLADAGKRDAAATNMAEQLGAISGISRGAISTMKDVVWSIDARNDTMGGMIQYMQEHLHNMLTPANIDFELNHTGISDNEKLPMEFRQNVYLIFKEAINNVVKHAGATRVQVDIQKESGYFVMQIKDDGIGLKEKKFNNGHGLYNMQLRADRLKATFDIVSDKGVTILLKVPV